MSQEASDENKASMLWALETWGGKVAQLWNWKGSQDTLLGTTEKQTKETPGASLMQVRGSPELSGEQTL